MKTNHILVCGFLALGGLSGVSNAAAEEEPAAKARKAQASDYAYVFEDDPIAASGDVAAGLRIAVRPVGQRSLLIRPRTQFIHEMFKSAENL